MHDIVSTGFIVSAEVAVPKGVIALRDIGLGNMLEVVSSTPIGLNIKTYRKARNLNQTQLAKELGVSQSRISDWETGRYGSIDLKNLLKIAKGQGQTIDEVIAGFDREYDQLVSERRSGGTSTAVGGSLQHAAADQARLLASRTAALARLVKDVQEVTARLINAYPVSQNALASQEDREPPTGASGTHSGPRRRRG